MCTCGSLVIREWMDSKCGHCLPRTLVLDLNANLASELALERSMSKRKNGRASLQEMG